MQLSTAVGTLALILAAALAAGHALGQDAIPPASAPTTMQKKVDEREAQRRAAAADQQKKKEDAPCPHRCSLRLPPEIPARR